LAIVDHLVLWFKAQNRRCRLGKFIDEMGLEAFRSSAMAGFVAPV